ncbi:hypothetical protein [Flavobacterium psychrophilum]|uniref:hypothetical protein n=1 Tax=Flavobacterium psychrophilum TaxID=96345 RepID=UPI001D06AA05|nr:hypothetical protein [Flavobacterium psychrophilum]MCB6099658.1 hypothetical protein [Flavobacterium psychrophilum]
MGKIKKKTAQHNKIKIPSENNIELDYPVFCFRHLQTVSNGDYKFYSDFVERLKKLSALTWHQINAADRHGFGTEKMPINKIKPQLPNFVTPEVETLTVFRANGDNRPFLGLRKGVVFHIIFIEEKFNDIYNH